MTFSQSDFRHVRWSLLTLLLVLGAGGAVILASGNFVEQAQRDEKEARRQLSEARARLATTEADRENMRTYTLEYNALLSRNIIGNDRRLDWVEGLVRMRQRGAALNQPDFKYAIIPQKVYAPAPALDSGNFELNRSDMTLRFDLLHEEQLMAFFDAMRSDIRGWFILDNCALERIHSAPEADAAAAAEQIRAACAGGWITLRKR